MKFNRIFLFLFVIGLLMVAPTIAQDTPTPDIVTLEATAVETLSSTMVPTDAATEAPTLEPTPAPVEPAPVIVDQVNFRVGIFGILAIVGTLVLSGFGIGAIWGQIRASKAAKDELERAYNAMSPEAQEKIALAHEQAQRAWDKVDELARQVLTLWGQVTDKLPNPEQPSS